MSPVCRVRCRFIIVKKHERFKHKELRAKIPHFHLLFHPCCEKPLRKTEYTQAFHKSFGLRVGYNQTQMCTADTNLQYNTMEEVMENYLAA